MKIKSTESVRVYRTEGGGCSLIFAIPLIGMGASILYLGIFVLNRSREPVFLGIAAGAFLVAGMILSVAIPVVSTRKGVTLDRIQGTATQWRTIFGRYKTLAVHNLNEFRSIEIYNHKKRSRSTTHIIELAGDSKRILLCDLGLLEPANEAASDVSTFLSLPVTDKTMTRDEP